MRKLFLCLKLERDNTKNSGKCLELKLEALIIHKTLQGVFQPGEVCEGT